MPATSFVPSGERPDDATTLRWLDELRRSHDERVRARIAESHLWLVDVCARQLRRYREPLDDLRQVGCVGLLRAIDRFDRSFGVVFRTYASSSISGEIRRHYRRVWVLRTPRSLQELHLAVSRARDELTGELGRSPMVTDIAARLHVTEEAVLEAMEAGANMMVQSLDVPGGPPANDARRLGGGSRVFDDVDARLSVESILDALGDHDADLLRAYHLGGESQTTLALRFDVSQSTISRLLRVALSRARTAAASPP